MLKLMDKKILKILCSKIGVMDLQYAVLQDCTYFSTKTCVVGAQKNRLNEKVLLSTHNKC